MFIRFSRSQDECDILSYLSNFIGNASVAVVGGTALATIAFVALNALGYEALTATAVAIALPHIPVALTVCGLAPLAGGIAVAGTILALVMYLGSNRSEPEPEQEEI